MLPVYVQDALAAALVHEGLSLLDFHGGLHPTPPKCGLATAAGDSRSAKAQPPMCGSPLAPCRNPRVDFRRLSSSGRSWRNLLTGYLV